MLLTDSEVRNRAAPHPPLSVVIPPFDSPLAHYAGTPLMDATREGHLDIVSMLREAGASDATLPVEAAPHHKVRNSLHPRTFLPTLVPAPQT